MGGQRTECRGEQVAYDRRPGGHGRLWTLRRSKRRHDWAGKFGPVIAGLHNYTIQIADGQGNATAAAGSLTVVKATGPNISRVVVAAARD